MGLPRHRQPVLGLGGSLEFGGLEVRPHRPRHAEEPELSVRRPEIHPANGCLPRRVFSKLSSTLITRLSIVWLEIRSWVMAFFCSSVWFAVPLNLTFWYSCSISALLARAFVV